MDKQKRARGGLVGVGILLWLWLGAPACLAEVRHALALGTTPKYGPHFSHFDYVNPTAPRGGHLRLAAVGGFDSFNPWILRGQAAQGVELTVDTLTVQSLDEPFTVYGLLAESFELTDNALVVRLRPQARFHDGSAVTAEDVVFTFLALTEQGSPLYRQYYAEVDGVEALDPHTVRFSFVPGHSPELPLIVGQLPVLSRAWWQGRDFSAPSLEPPLGSGPYRVEAVRPGQSVTYRRDPTYWGQDLPVNRGRHNVDRITYDTYRDTGVTLEAFLAGQYDFRLETSAKNWHTGYRGPAVASGRIRRERLPHQLPQGMQCFALNLRRPVFADPRVRQAIALAFDFEWSNRALFHGEYTRSRSFFANSELAAQGEASPEEMALLEPWRAQLPASVLEPWVLPATDASGYPRDNLRRALELLAAAGYQVVDGVMTRDGQPLRFELLLVQPEFERVVLPFQRNLAKIGVVMRVRLMDVAQYVGRLRQFDYDMIVTSFPQSLSPGAEQRSYWTSAAARSPGSRNYCGIASPAIDALVEAIVGARDRHQLQMACRALDRALLHGWYVVPQWHATTFRVAYWDHLHRPATTPPYGLDLQSWWIEPQQPGEVRP